MTDNLLYLQVWMFLGCVVVEQSFEVSDEVVTFIGDLQICHHDVVGSVGPAVFDRHVGPVGFTGKI